MGHRSKHYKVKRNNCMENVKSIDFSVAGVITVTLGDGTTQVFSTAPVVTDTEVTVTHGDGTTEVFEPKAA